MKLLDLVKGQEALIKKITGNPDIEITRISQDSRIVEKGHAFVAIKGYTVDGHTFIEKVIDQGVTVVFAETPAPASIKQDLVWVQTSSSAELMGHLASAWYQHPSQQMEVVGVTGTNGKTTVATLLWQVFAEGGKKCGLVSTVENRIGETTIPSTHTTPDALSLQALFAQMRDAGCQYVFMEVSSHAIDQRRIAGTRFVGGVFTNLTHDHLDYHGTFAEYLKAKKLFFDHLPSGAFAITNLDDRNGKVMVQNTKAKIITYGLKHMADIKGKVIENALSGLHLQINQDQVYARMIGSFNALNLLAAFGVALSLGMQANQALRILSNLTGAEGRFEYIAHPNLANCGGIVDYAHTPDALEKVIKTILGVQKKGTKLITVVGCGGNRDKAKRPIMAQIAVENSHLTILTSDNPRDEDPLEIIEQMEAGLSKADTQKYLSIADRGQAIKTACRMLQVGDVVLVAGKGHEKYQEIKGIKHPFDDKEILISHLI
jgi:UDP-N-acetylmuramoyl-L-alanyl-D-glutamate--2,6-diaminopimelate ligase